MLLRFSIITMLLFLIVPVDLTGSEDAKQIETNLQTLEPVNARGYLMPFMESYSANINRSTFHTAEIREGLDIYLGIRAMFAVIPDDDRTYTAFSSINNSLKETATLVGTEGNGEFPDGFNWKVVPVMIPQLNIGNIFGTQLSVRYLPSTKFDDKIGDLDVVGGGVTHSISQYLPELPIQFAVQGFYQYTKLGNVFKSTGTVYNFLASARISGLTLYGGLGYENTDVNVRYYFLPDEEQTAVTDRSAGIMEFNESFEDNLRTTVGMSLKFIIFNLNADYSFGNYHVATIGLGISI